MNHHEGKPAARAVVFAYHNVGVRCLSVLLAHGVDVPLVLTHGDHPAENIWFDSVAELAARHDIAILTPDDPNTPDIVAHVRAQRPDFLFSFYYRQMIRPELLAVAARGALNMHGSLLPKYRGRAPVNWAVLHGERETGATLHYMTDKPDAGAIVAQQAVPILPNDTAGEVFHKVTCAAEVALDHCLPALLAGAAPAHPQALTQGAYFGGRRPQDGEIDWRQSGGDIHNLIRAVAPPYPGAFTVIEDKPVHLLGSIIMAGRRARFSSPTLYCEASRCYADCADGAVLRLVAFEADGERLDAARFITVFGAGPHPLRHEAQPTK